MLNHQPKGSLCINCKNRKNDCSSLPFSSMPVIETVGEIKIVYCKFYNKGNNASISS
jgi:hypothetical protein